LLPVPQQEIQLANGLLEGSNLIDSLGLQNCKSEIQSILSALENLRTTTGNRSETFSEFAKIFASISTVYSKCPEFETNLRNSLSFTNKAYHFPGKFLSAGISELIGISGIRKLWNLIDELKKEDLTEAGVTFGQILNNFANSDFAKQENLTFLADAAKAKIVNDGCLDVLNRIEADIKTMISNLFSDIRKVKAALDDFFVQLKTIPNVCI